MSIYGKPTPAEVKPLHSVTPSLQEQISILEKRKTHLGKLIEISVQNARESKTKEEALRFIKLKVKYANEINTIFGMLDKLEGLDNATQRLQFQKSMINVTKQATTVIKENTIDAGKVEDIMDDVEEAMDNVNEVSDILSRINPTSRDVQAELDALFEEAKPIEIKILDFPEVPQQISVEKELRILVTN